MYVDDFDAWNRLKKEIHSQSDRRQLFPKEGEVWMSAFGRNLGFEQNGSGDNFARPVLITKKFNNHMFWIVPLSTRQKNIDFYYNFTDPEGRLVSAILAQMKLMSVKRLKRKLYDIPNILQEIKDRIMSFLV